MSAPDLLRARVAFRDRSVSDVLDLALRFLVVHARTYGKIALGTLLPAAALSLIVGWSLGWRVAWAVSLPLAVIAEIPFTMLASRLVFEEQVRARDVLVSALRTGPRVVFVRMIAMTLVALAAAFLLIPGVWLATIFLFLGEVMLLERASAGQAFGRSQRVAASAASEVLVGLLVLALVTVGGVLLADIAGRTMIEELFQFRPPQALWATGGSALATIGLFVQVPYLATARFFLYLNVRTRTEGWDIQTRFAAIAARADERHEAA